MNCRGSNFVMTFWCKCSASSCWKPRIAGAGTSSRQFPPTFRVCSDCLTFLNASLWIRQIWLFARFKSKTFGIFTITSALSKFPMLLFDKSNCKRLVIPLSASVGISFKLFPERLRICSTLCIPWNALVWMVPIWFLDKSSFLINIPWNTLAGSCEMLESWKLISWINPSWGRFTLSNSIVVLKSLLEQSNIIPFVLGMHWQRWSNTWSVGQVLAIAINVKRATKLQIVAEFHAVMIILPLHSIKHPKM